jgi:hypothetical protein
MPELRFGPNGYLDLSALPDGDPDAVLPADALAALRAALAASQPEVDDDQWDDLVRAVVSGELARGRAPVTVPGALGASSELLGWAATATDGGDVPPDERSDDRPGEHGDALAAAMGGLHHDRTDGGPGGADHDDLADPWVVDVDLHDAFDLELHLHPVTLDADPGVGGRDDA